MTSTATTTGPGRPAIGSVVKARLSEDLLGRVDAWAAAQGVSKRAGAIRELLELALVGGTAPVAETLSDLFPEVGDDFEYIWDLIDEEVELRGLGRGGLPAFGQLESTTNYDMFIEVGVYQIRGRWIVYSRTAPVITDTKGHRRVDNDHRVDEAVAITLNDDTAIDAYTHLVQRLTRQHYNPTTGPLWDGETINGTVIGDNTRDFLIPWKGLIPAGAITQLGE